MSPFERDIYATAEAAAVRLSVMSMEFENRERGTAFCIEYDNHALNSRQTEARVIAWEVGVQFSNKIIPVARAAGLL